MIGTYILSTNLPTFIKFNLPFSKQRDNKPKSYTFLVTYNKKVHTIILIYQV